MQREDFDLVGDRTEGFSGSDLSVLVREALMEPLRVCQQAKQFVQIYQGQTPMMGPCVKYPHCPRCPMALSTNDEAARQRLAQPCGSCGARRMGLYDVESEALLVPVVSSAMFGGVLDRARKSVDPAELQKFVDWTAEFGQEG